ncbi:MAG: MinD/ParA family protein [Sedimentisphaerales bacterium]|nr:MinD/ParA family protein [Sedimentisphaerales bacterium]
MIVEQQQNPQFTDQAERLRRMVRSTQRTARVLAITSGKGGVGKTNVAANLSLCLSAAGKEVILLDADLGLANLDIILPVNSHTNLSQVISGRKRLQDIIQTGPGGVRMICGGSGLTQLADLDDFQRRQIIQDMSTLELQSDIIIIDTAAGISKNVLGFCQASDHTLVVTTPEPTSITDAYAMIKILTQSHTHAKISLLVNMAQNRTQAKNIYQRIAVVTRKFLAVPLYDAGYILHDEHLPQAVSKRKPVVLAYPHSSSSCCFMALAQKLARVQKNKTVQEGFFRKISNWLF